MPFHRRSGGRAADGDRAFVEWSATFDCEAGQRGELAKTLEGWFAQWLESLRDAVAGKTPGFHSRNGPASR
jgi:hypothetical protein